VSHQSDTLAAGYKAVVDSDGVIHKTEGPCFKEGARYVPCGSIDDAVSHDYGQCTRCCGGSTQPKDE